MRSGTLAAPLIAGLGAAAEIAQRDMAFDAAHISRLSHRLVAGLRSRLQHIVMNGPELESGDRSVQQSIFAKREQRCHIHEREVIKFF